MKKIKRTALTKRFMEDHGKKKKEMKVSWDTYISLYDKQLLDAPKEKPAK